MLCVGRWEIFNSPLILLRFLILLTMSHWCDCCEESVWFITVYCFFTVGSVKFLQLLFVVFVGEELTVFRFAREECEKNFESH